MEYWSLRWETIRNSVIFHTVSSIEYGHQDIENILHFGMNQKRLLLNFIDFSIESSKSTPTKIKGKRYL